MERTTRFTTFVALPTDRKAHTVRDAIASNIYELHDHLHRPLTGNQGEEMAALDEASTVPGFDCDVRLDADIGLEGIGLAT
jgi:IS30 family transposase